MAERFWNEFKQISDYAGLFIVRRNQAKRLQQKIFQGFCVVFYSIVTLILLYAAVHQKEDGLVIQVVNGIFILTMFIICGIIYELINNHQAIDELLKWCTERGHQKFDKILQPAAGNKFNLSRNICSRLLWFNHHFFMILGLLLTVMVGGAMQFVPSLRYKLPIPYHMPVKNWRTLKVFLFTLLVQSISVFIMAQILSFFVSLIMVYFIQVFVYLKITVDGIIIFKKELEDKKKVNVDETMKVFIKMILSVIRVMLSFTKMMKNIVMSIEVISFCSILINACIFLIEKQKEHYLIGASILMFNAIAMGIALVNDLLKDKVHQIMLALYDLPWDEFNPKQRMLIRFSMYCIEINTQFHSSNNTEFNLERFGKITKTAYSNTLVLKRMIEKSMAQHGN